PRLRDAAATGVRLLRVEDLRDAADTEVVEVADQPLEQRARLGCALRIDAAERVDVGTDQPGPYRALVVRGVTSAQVAPVARSVPRRPWCERSQPDRSKQLARDDIEHLPPARLVEDRVRQRDGEHLVRPQRRIIAVLPVHHVVEVAALGVPEALIEGCARAVCRRVELVRGLRVASPPLPACEQPLRVIPERIDLYGLSPTRCDDPV